MKTIKPVLQEDSISNDWKWNVALIKTVHTTDHQICEQRQTSLSRNIYLAILINLN